LLLHSQVLRQSIQEAIICSHKEQLVAKLCGSVLIQGFGPVNDNCVPIWPKGNIMHCRRQIWHACDTHSRKTVGLTIFCSLFLYH
jgi:hypothetical protein